MLDLDADREYLTKKITDELNWLDDWIGQMRESLDDHSDSGLKCTKAELEKVTSEASKIEFPAETD